MSIDHGLTVHDVPRPKAHAQRPTECEPPTAPTGLTSHLRDLRAVPLADVAAAVRDGDAGLAESLRRIAPRDGAGVPVAAFNSSI